MLSVWIGGLSIALSLAWYYVASWSAALIVIATVAFASAIIAWRSLRPYLILGQPFDMSDAPRAEFDQRRGSSYPQGVPNTWYAVAFSEEVRAGAEAPLHIRAFGQALAVWRTKEGRLVVQSAFCPHLGANLAVGGRITDDCLTW